jgi:hypothetical protein
MQIDECRTQNELEYFFAAVFNLTILSFFSKQRSWGVSKIIESHKIPITSTI